MSRTEIIRISDQLERAYRGDAWHGTPVRTLLDGVDHLTAARAVVPGVQTIWQLTLHIEIWLTVVRRRASGEVIDPSPAEDWPSVGGSDASSWQRTLTGLDGAFERLLDRIESLDDAALMQSCPGKDYSIYILLHGAIQHTLWHGGQIAMLIRAAKERS